MAFNWEDSLEVCREGEQEEGTAAQTTLALRSVREEPPEALRRSSL